MDQDNDYETLELIAQLQLMDLEEMRAGFKGKGRRGTLSDVELTYNAMEAGAHATLQFIRDYRIAKGAERAVHEDLDLINTMAEIEAREQADRRYALVLSNNPDAPPLPEIGFGYRSAQRLSPSASSSSSRLWSVANSSASHQSSPSTSSSVESSPRLVGSIECLT